MLEETTVPRVLLGGPLSGKTTRLVQAFLAHVRQDGIASDRVLCLSFFAGNAEAIRRALREKGVAHLPWVTTVQRFLTLLLRDYAAPAGVPERTSEISPAARALVIRQAWAEVAGPLWRDFGAQPGAVRELTKVIDWLSQNRTRYAPAAGELSDDELAQTYRHYISLCTEHQWLTFQEASLRALDLLADARIAAEVQARFPAVLIDDLHLARPDQLALVGALRGKATRFTATAWLAQDQSAPELRHLWDSIKGWAAVEPLPIFAPAVNPKVAAVAARATDKLVDWDTTAGVPVALVTPASVEDEMHAVAQAIVRALLADGTLHPDEIVVVAADGRLLPFAQRVLARYGLPVAPLELAANQTPLLRGGLLALRRAIRGASAEGERDLLSLPYVGADVLDLDALYQSALAYETTILSLTVDERPAISTETARILERLRACLAQVDAAPCGDSVEAMLRELGALRWAQDANSFPQATRDVWIEAWSAWLARVRELEEMARRLGTSADDTLSLIEGLAAERDDPAAEGRIRLVDSARVNGIGGRAAFVIGLSESAAPVQQSLMQLVEEDRLGGLFGDGRPVVLPQAREQQAWIERESRRVALLLSRGRERVQVSVSQYAAGGDTQLPSPFFERLLGGEGEIDRDGGLHITKPGVWAWAELQDGPECALPMLDSIPPAPVAAGTEETLAAGHTFSASQIRMYLTCPLQYFYGRVLGIETEEVSLLERGSLVHEVLCATMGDGALSKVNLMDRERPTWMNNANRLWQRAEAALAAAWSGEPVNLPAGGIYTPTREWAVHFGPDLQRRAVRRWAAKVLANWAEFETEVMTAGGERRPILLEMPFNLRIGGYNVLGRIDRIDEVRTTRGLSYELIDYKTGKGAADSLPAQVQKFLPAAGEAPKDYQLPLYALAMIQGVGGLRTEPSLLSYLNLDSLEKGKRGFGVAARRTIGIVRHGKLDPKAGLVPLGVLTAEISAGIVQTMDAMRHSPYAAKPDFYCNWCAFRAACDRGRALARESA